MLRYGPLFNAPPPAHHIVCTLWGCTDSPRTGFILIAVVLVFVAIPLLGRLLLKLFEPDIEGNTPIQAWRQKRRAPR